METERVSDEPTPPETTVAPALTVGAAKGALAGFFVGVPLGLLVFWVAQSLRRAYGPGGSPSPPYAELLQTVVGSVLAGACLCGFDAASARLGKLRHARSARFAAGFLVPLCFLMPALGIQDLDAQHGNFEGEAVLGVLVALLVVGTALGLGWLAAGPPRNEAHEPQGIGRLFVAALVFTLLGLVAISIADGRANGLGGAFLPCLIGSGVAAVVLWVAQRFATPLVRPLARWLEPDRDFEGAKKARDFRAAEEKARELIASAHVTPAEALRESLLDRAERKASELAALATASPGVGSVGRAELLRAEVYLARGNLDAAEKLLPVVDHEPALHAELLRRRGDLAGAERVLGEWARCEESETTPEAALARANARALLALVRCDQGRFDEARALVAQAGAGDAPRVFHHLRGLALLAEIDAAHAEAQAGGASGPARAEPPAA
jgi:hypothetical protein